MADVNPMSDLHQRLAAELNWLQQAPDLILPDADQCLSLPRQAVPPALVQQLPVDAFNPGYRLGNRFEELIYFYLKYICQLNDIKRNIQIKPTSVTLGELDFLFPLNDQWIHLEVALKLYLLDGAGNALSQFIGTRRADCLAKKWQHMQHQQLPLSQRPEVKPILQQMGLRQTPRPTLWIKGWLFYHLGVRPVCVPAPLNPAHQQGWWCRQSELDGMLDSTGNDQTRYLIPQKADWLLPAHLLQQPALERNQLQQTLATSDNAQLVWVLQQDTNGWRELSRGFVVTDSWGEEEDGRDMQCHKS